MNYLAHLYLSDPQPLCRIGNLMGDFVKGPLSESDWHPELLRGLRQHRAIDSYSHDHPAVRAGKVCLDDRFGLLKPILIDIFYDHLLACNWQEWTGGSLEEFAAQAYDLLEARRHRLVPNFQPVARRMIDHDWLTSYRDPAIIGLVLERISRRLKRDNRLAEGIGELRRCRDQLEASCHQFLRQARSHLDGLGQTLPAAGNDGATQRFR